MRVDTMRGIEIRPVEFPWGAGKPPDARPFEIFFQPILGALAPFHWVYADDLPFLNEAEDDEFGQLCESWLQGYFPPDTLLPRYAHNVINDWFSLFGFRQSPAEDIRCRLRRGTTNYAGLSRVVDLCVFNVDAAYWELYTRDEQMLDAVARHVGAMTGVTITEKRLEARDRGL